jgi:hypothetical protein
VVYRRLSWLVPGLLASTWLIVGSSSCKTATGVRVGYKSDLTCNAGRLPQSLRFSLQRVGTPTSFDTNKPETPRASADCTAGTPSDLGDLLIRPNPNDPGLDYELVTAAATGTTSTEAACGIGSNGAVAGKLEGAECIVSKRRVRFAEGQELSFQVFLSARCAGISCPSETTCDPLTALCVGIPTNGEPPTQDAGVQGQKIEPEAGPTSDASVSDATVEAGPPTIPDCSVKPGQTALCGRTYSLSAADPFPIVAHENVVAFVTDRSLLSTLTEVSFLKATPTATTFQPLAVTGVQQIVGLGYDEAGNLYAGVRFADTSRPDSVYKRSIDWSPIAFRSDTNGGGTHMRLLSLVTSPSGLGGLFGNSETPTSVVPFLIEDKAGAIEPTGDLAVSFTVAPRPEVWAGSGAKNRVRLPLPPSSNPMGTGLVAFDGTMISAEPGALPPRIPPVTELVGGDPGALFYVAKDATSTKLFLTLPGALGPSPSEQVDGVEGPTAFDGDRFYVVSQGRLLSIAKAAPHDICRVASASASPANPVRAVAVGGNCVYSLSETRGTAPVGRKLFEIRSSFLSAPPM